MQPIAQDPQDILAREHDALLRGYGRAQARCSDLLREQAQAIARLDAQVMRLRAAVIVRETALGWEREDRQSLERAIPGLPRRLTLARRVDALLARVQDLMRTQLRSQMPAQHMPAWQTPPRPASAAGPAPAAAAGHAALFALPPDPAGLEASLAAADLVICQTGCVSHGAYWRVEDHCRRTGKACVLVDQPNALSIVRIQAHADDCDTPDLFKP